MAVLPDVQEKFEEIFSKFDSSGKGGLYWKDMWTMIKHYRNVFDPTGWTAMFLEWGALWLIAADKEVIRSPLTPLSLLPVHAPPFCRPSGSAYRVACTTALLYFHTSVLLRMAANWEVCNNA